MRQPNPTPIRTTPTSRTSAPAGLVEVDRLIAFPEGRLGPPDEPEVRATLAASPAAMAELADLAAFDPPDLGADRRLSAEEIGRAWQAFSRRLDTETQAPVVTFVPRHTSPVRRAAPWLALAAAAALAVFGIGLVPSANQSTGPVGTAPSTKVLATLGFEEGMVPAAAVVSTTPETPLFEGDFETGDTAWTVHQDAS